MAKGSAGSGSNQYDHYGVIAGRVGTGPFDVFASLIVNGETVWPIAEPWVDGVWRVTTEKKSRASNVAAVRLSEPHRMIVGDKLTVESFSDTSFNVALGTVLSVPDANTLTYASTGSDVSENTDTGGRVTKGSHYVAPNLVLWGNKAWQSATDHYATPDAPPSYENSDWTPYFVERDGSNPDYIDLTTSRGPAAYYWGTATQEVDPVLAANNYGDVHPPYKFLSYIRLGEANEGFLFGREIDTVPQTRVIVGKFSRPATDDQTPWVDGEDIAADSFVSDGGTVWHCSTAHTASPTEQPSGANTSGYFTEVVWRHNGHANPFLMFYEILTDERFGLNASNVANPIRKAYEAGLDPERRFVSVLWSKQEDYRSVADTLEAEAGIILLENPQTGAFEISEWPRTANGDGLPVVTFHDMVDGSRPRLNPGDSEDIVSSVDVTFSDEDMGYVRTPEMTPNLALVKRREGVVKPVRIESKLYTRRKQVKSYGVEYLKQVGNPPLSGTIECRRGAWEAKSIEVGTLFVLQIDEDPAGFLFNRVVRCIEVSTAKTAVEVKWELDRAYSPVPYVKQPSQRIISQSPEPPPIEVARFVPLPAVLADGFDNRIAALVSRPSRSVVAFRADYAPEEDGNYQVLATARGFALFCYLTADVTAPDNWEAGTTYVLDDEVSYAGKIWVTSSASHLADASNRPGVGVMWTTVPAAVALWDDGEFARIQTGFTDTEQGGDRMLAVIVELDMAGQIATDTDGQPKMEIASLGSVAATGSTSTAYGRENNIYSFDLLRGRQGTISRAFGAGAEVWLIEKADVVALSHGDFPNLRAIGGSAWFKLKPETIRRSRTTEDAAIEFQFISAELFGPAIAFSTPTGTTVIDPSPDTVTFSGSVTDPDNNLIGFILRRRLSDSGVWETLGSADFSERGLWGFSYDAAFDTAGLWVVQARAVDVEGNVVTSERLVWVDPVTDQVEAPTITPNGGTWRSSQGSFGTTLVMADLATGTAGADTQYSLTADTATAPGSWTTAASVQVFKGAVPGSTVRLWAQATNGVDPDSEIVFADFQFQ